MCQTDSSIAVYEANAKGTPVRPQVCAHDCKKSILTQLPGQLDRLFKIMLNLYDRVISVPVCRLKKIPKWSVSF